jgi:hypothetical protein
MNGQIVSRDYMHAKGRAAFEAGEGRDDHHMNPGSVAIEEWQAGWDRAALLAKQVARRRPVALAGVAVS